MRAHTVKRAVAVLGCATLIACGDNPRTEADTEFSIAVDTNVQPETASLPSIDGGEDRPLAALADPDGKVATFVENELLITTDDREALDAFLAAYGGEILLEIDPSEAKLEDLDPMVLVRLNLEGVDSSGLEGDLEALAGEHELGALGEHRLSSNEAAALLAIAAAGSRAGLQIGVNWLLEDHAIPDSTTEAPSGPESNDAYQWSQWRRDAGAGHGVPEAWTLLHHADKLGHRVKIGILDGGFSPDADFRGGVGISVVPFVFDPFDTPNAASCTGGSSCPWHGTWVGSAAMAIPDNSFGSAGRGGPVGEPVWVYTTPDYVISIGAVIAARAAGAKVINMSYGARVPTIVAWTVYPFEAATQSVRASGALLFASSGNEGTNVDREKCLPLIGWPCWEVAWHTPCENDGVICVGGLDGTHRDPDSNYGSEHVDLYAPFTVQVGPDPDNLANARQHKSGTSFSSPFAAGVAALVWAARPSLSAGQVWSLIRDNARSHSGLRSVDAYEAVLAAIDLGLAVEITSPYAGAEIALHLPTHFSADVGLVSRPGDPVDVELRWSSNRDGVLQTATRSLTRTSADGVNVHPESLTAVLSAGSHVIRLRATAGGLEVSDTVTVVTVNSAPQATLLQPGTGSEYCAGELITFRGSAFDSNETLGDSAYQWSSSIDAQFGVGSVVSESGLSAGDHVITLTVSDSDGGTDHESIAIRVLAASHPDCADLPPVAVITSPENNASMQIDGYDAAAGAAYKDLTLSADVSDDHDAAGDLTVEWFSDVLGSLGSGATLDVRIHMTESCSQAQEITVRVEDSGGNVTEDTVRIYLWVVC